MAMSSKTVISCSQSNSQKKNNKNSTNHPTMSENTLFCYSWLKVVKFYESYYFEEVNITPIINFMKYLFLLKDHTLMTSLRRGAENFESF